MEMIPRLKEGLRVAEKCTEIKRMAKKRGGIRNMSENRSAFVSFGDWKPRLGSIESLVSSRRTSRFLLLTEIL